jgi:hypothetical protein
MDVNGGLKTLQASAFSEYDRATRIGESKPTGNADLLIEFNMQTPHKGSGSAHDMAVSLLPLLEAIANLHYLLDLNISEPAKLKELRAIEEEGFTAVLTLVQSYLAEPPVRSIPLH